MDFQRRDPKQASGGARPRSIPRARLSRYGGRHHLVIMGGLDRNQHLQWAGRQQDRRGKRSGAVPGEQRRDAMIRRQRTITQPTRRQREARLGYCTERENLTGDAKGKGTSGSNREAESTDALERDGLPRSSDEAAVMAVERRGRVTEVESDQPAAGRVRSSTEGGSLRTVARAG